MKQICYEKEDLQHNKLEVLGFWLVDRGYRAESVRGDTKSKLY